MTSCCMSKISKLSMARDSGGTSRRGVAGDRLAGNMLGGQGHIPSRPAATLLPA